MKCMFCDMNLINHDSMNSKGAPITVAGRGYAHKYCAEQDLIQKRVFGPLHLTDIATNDLQELKEMVLSELNERLGVNTEIELF